MSHHHHQRLRRDRPVSDRLPRSAYGALVGTVSGPLSDADDNHVFIFVRVATGEHRGRYRLAFNTECADRTSVQYSVQEEPITLAEAPAEGFTEDASLSYHDLGLRQADFRAVANGRLRTIVHASAEESDLVGAYGFTFDDGTGMHDLHFNNGEPRGSRHPNRADQDGAIAFYYLNRFGHTIRRWVFVKFQTQELS